MMKTLILIILAIIIMLPPVATAQDDGQAHVNSCVSHDVDTLWLWPDNVFLHSDYLTTLTGEPVQWLGYAPRELDFYVYDGSQWIKEYQYLERTGQGYAYGLNLYEAEQQYIVYLYEDKQPVERWTITAFEDEYFVTRTSDYRYARSDGTAYDYHILPNPDGGACMWLVRGEAIEMMLGERRGR